MFGASCRSHVLCIHYETLNIGNVGLLFNAVTEGALQWLWILTLLTRKGPRIARYTWQCFLDSPPSFTVAVIITRQVRISTAQDMVNCVRGRQNTCHSPLS